VPTAIVAVTEPVLLFLWPERGADAHRRRSHLGHRRAPRARRREAHVLRLVAVDWVLWRAIFPVIFAGTCFGLALNLAIPAIPQGVAVMAVITGMTVAATAAPLSVTIFLALIAEPSLTSIIGVAAVAATSSGRWSRRRSPASMGRLRSSKQRQPQVARNEPRRPASSPLSNEGRKN